MRTTHRVAEVERCSAVGAGKVDTLDVKRHDEVGADGIGEPSALRLRHEFGGRRTSQEHLRAQGGEAALDASAHIGQDLRFGQGESFVGGRATRVEDHDLPGANGAATFYFGDPMGGAHSLSGRCAAESVQDAICTHTDLTDCRSHPRTWDLLRLTRMPAVWIELGYLSHPRDAARLMDPRFRDVLGQSISSAVVRFFAPISSA
jgi:hypothetical protein